MKNFLLACISTAIVVSTVQADVTGLTARFAGGCNVENTDGSCVIKVTASGTDLTSETVRLYVADSSEGSLQLVSPRLRSLTQEGTARFKVANKAGGCYQVRTGPNGNDKPDARSSVLCQ